MATQTPSTPTNTPNTPTTPTVPRPRGRVRPALAAEIRRRARKLTVTYPAAKRVARLDNPALTAVTDAHRAALSTVADKATPVAVLAATLLDARHRWEVFEQANSDDDGGSGDSSDCIRGCDELLKDCAESWGEAIGGTDIDIFDAETEEADDSSGSIDLGDNPLDVENDDPGDTGGSDDSSDTRDEDGLTAFETGVVAGFCGIQYTACVAGCLLSGAFG